MGKGPNPNQERTRPTWSRSSPPPPRGGRGGWVLFVWKTFLSSGHVLSAIEAYFKWYPSQSSYCQWKTLPYKSFSLDLKDTCLFYNLSYERGAKTIKVSTGFTFVSRVILYKPKINNKCFKFSNLSDVRDNMWFNQETSCQCTRCINPLTAEQKVNIISSSDTCFTVTWAIM